MLGLRCPLYPASNADAGAVYAGAIILVMFLAASLRFVVTLEHLYDRASPPPRKSSCLSIFS
ncbi:hypothetical protein FOMG_16954 [Fusarium oxysporum f. sp. melonis 26406]|uniref:Uncharacterized protein n=2 Tax=Fusarium oxysporum TaxID=5507 RepID=W9J5L8_FUSOX|nr:hypothetical protein FOYG_04003 [Fusarium oxysporum NRRL 32931]EXK26484.1 hypothetical protein FOMG_16954 [Fusarium oxysporum f. sp. melonis 26406]